MVISRLQPGQLFAYTLYFLFRASANLLFLALTAVFLKRLGVEALSYQYIVSNVIIILVQAVLVSRAGWQNRHLLLGSLAGYGLVALGCFAASFGDLPAFFYFGALVLIAVFEPLAYTALFELSSELLPRREFKREIAKLIGIGTMGNVLAGFSLKYFNDLLAIPWLFLFSVVAFAVAILMVARMGKVRPANPPGRATASSSTENSSFKRLLQTNPVAVTLLGMAFVSFFVRFLLDYRFSAAMTDYMSSETTLAGALGMFSSALEMVSTLLQLFIIPSLFATQKVGRILLFVPSFAIAMAAIVLVSGQFYAILAFQYIFGLCNRSLLATGVNVLLNPVPEHERKRLRVALSFALNAGILFCGLYLAVFRAISGTTFIMTSIIAGSVILFALITRIDDRYFALLMAVLSKKSNGEGKKGRALVHKLFSQDSRERAAVFESLKSSDFEKGSQQIFSALKGERSKLVFSSALRKLATCDNEVRSELFQRLSGYFLETGNHRSLANLLEVRDRKQLWPSWLDFAKAMLSHEHARVRGAAVVAVLRHAEEMSAAEEAFSALIGMIRSDREDSRSSAAIAMGKLKKPYFLPALTALVADTALGVRKNAVIGLGMMATADSIAALRRLAPSLDRDLGLLAEQMSALAHRGAMRRIFSVLNSVTAQERMLIERLLLHTERENTREVLRRALKFPDPSLRLRILAFADLYARDDRANNWLLAMLRADNREEILEALLWENKLLVSEMLGQILQVFDSRSWRNALKNLGLRLIDLSWVYSLALNRSALMEPALISKMRLKRFRLIKVAIRLLLFSSGHAEKWGRQEERGLFSLDANRRALTMEFIEQCIGAVTLQVLDPLVEACLTPQSERLAVPAKFRLLDQKLSIDPKAWMDPKGELNPAILQGL